MSSVNKVILIGNLGRDPEVRYSASGEAIANLAIATSRRYKDKTSGEMVEDTEWHRVACFRQLAEQAGEHLKKGRKVYVEGALKTRKWTDKDGVEKYTTEILANSIEFLDARGSGDDTQEPAQRPAARPQAAPARPAPPQRPAAPAQRPAPPQRPAAARHSSDGWPDDDIPL